MAVTHQRRPDISIAMMQTVLMETTVTVAALPSRGFFQLVICRDGPICGVGASGLSHMAMEFVA
jgi:hypothetical protein